MKRTVSVVTCQILEILLAVRVLEWLPKRAGWVATWVKGAENLCIGWGPLGG